MNADQIWLINEVISSLQERACLEMNMFNASDSAPRSEIKKRETRLQSAARIIAACGLDMKSTHQLMCWRLGS